MAMAYVPLILSDTIRDDLVSYVKEQHLPGRSKERIRDFCSEQPPITLTVYRGHTNSKIIRAGMWHSATKTKSVAVKEFAGKECCVFTIHLIRVPCIDINDFVGDLIGSYASENEIIILDGGIFYKDAALSEEGYADMGIGEDGKQEYESGLE